MVTASTASQTEGIWIIDAEARTVYANEIMAGILGTTAAELAGKHSFLYVYPEDLPSAQKLFDSKQGGSPAPFHFKLRREDGSSIWVDVQGTPMRTSEGAFDGIVGTFTVSALQAA